MKYIFVLLVLIVLASCKPCQSGLQFIPSKGVNYFGFYVTACSDTIAFLDATDDTLIMYCLKHLNTEQKQQVSEFNNGDYLIYINQKK
jgi:hypothetical protein